MYQIAIDGPPGTGKSTLAKRLSERLGILYLDSGAAYRAFALHCINSGVDISEDFNVEGLFRTFDLDFEAGKILVNAVDVTEDIRTSHISDNVCYVAGNAIVRKKLTAYMKSLASTKSVVMDGRDVASNILDGAEYKFFITASLEVRTERRLQDLIASGEDITYEELYSSIKEREETEYNREVGALQKHPDAIVIDSTDKSVDKIVDYIISIIEE